LYGAAEVVDTQEEAETVVHRLNAYLARERQAHAGDFTALRGLLAAHLHGDELQLSVECSSLIGPGLAYRAVPEAFADVDRDGLTPIGRLDPIAPGVYRFGDLALFAHRSFRRAHHPLNRLNEQFLRCLEALDRARMETRVALDPDVVGLASSHQEYAEREYWWGPRFDDDLRSIPTGVAHHEADELQRAFHGVGATEFWWQSRDGYHIFEAEELAERPVRLPGDERYLCRYVHAMVGETDGRIGHFDGAVRAYDDEAMLRRWDADIARAGRHAAYTKLWRVDGDIRASEWKAALSDYFRGNPLVGEYLGAAPQAGRAAAGRADGVAAVVRPPGWMPAGTGVRVALSFHPVEAASTATPSVVSLDRIGIEEDQVPMIEWVGVELRKAIERLGGALHVPPGLRLVKYQDCYANLPLVRHTGPGAHAAAAVTLRAIGSISAAWEARGVSCAVEFEADGRMVRVAAIGHTSDIALWLAGPLALPPELAADTPAWADAVAEWLRGFDVTSAPVVLGDTLMPTGVFRFNRHRVDPDFASTENLRIDARSVRYEAVVAPGQEEVAGALAAAGMRPALAMAVEATRCGGCGGSYLSCGCSKLLDVGAPVELTRVTPLGVVWTDKPDIGEDDQ
jgi:hypothetical protein